jgi:hypothetical protein
MHVASKSDELHLLSSLHTLSYIEFDNLCNLDCLEERIFAHADLPWLSKPYLLLANITTKDNILYITSTFVAI